MSAWYRHPTVVFGSIGLVITAVSAQVTTITMNPAVTNYAGIAGVCEIVLTLSAIITPLFSMRAPKTTGGEQEESA